MNGQECQLIPTLMELQSRTAVRAKQDRRQQEVAPDKALIIIALRASPRLRAGPTTAGPAAEPGVNKLTCNNLALSHVFSDSGMEYATP